MSAMLFDLPSDDRLYAALLSRDPAYDGRVYVGVTSTGVFCRLTCPARKPRRENTVFFEAVGGAMAAGFRPCQRCRPLAQAGEREPLVARLVDLLDRDADRRWSEQDLVQRGFDPSTVRRAFRRHFGVTFLDMARLRRLGRGMDRLASGAEVVEAQLDAGFESASGFRAAFTRLVGHPPGGARGREVLKVDWIDTPIGAMMAVADRHALHLLEFLDRRALPGEMKSLQVATRSTVGIGRVPPIDQIERELSAFFAGTAVRFATPLVLSGSAFTVRVWDALRAIPFGETRSYAAIARDIGQASAVRAVARANGANRFAIAIPCHRVIGSDGALTGYGGGLWRKRWLIAHECRVARQGSTSGME